ncbi:MAG: metal-dependent hydrolase [archaeon]|nr:metal-dependent hydrolase [archaeon]
MPQAAAHILIPLILMSIVRDYYIQRGKKFPLHYVLIAGIAGAIPDLDVAAFWILNFFNFTWEEVHRTFAHTIFVPLIFLGLAFITIKANTLKIGKHKLKWNIIFLMIAIGAFSHLILDAIFGGSIMLFYPLSTFSIGLDLFGYLPEELAVIAAPSLDGGLIIIWLIYLEMKHKISNFI